MLQSLKLRACFLFAAFVAMLGQMGLAKPPVLD